MSDTDMVERRARNFYVFAGAVIVYLLAGADLEHLTVLGLRVPSLYPVVFSAAAVFAMIWFWWRYLTAWLDAGIRSTFRHEYLAALHETPFFRRYIMKRIDLQSVIDKAASEADPTFPKDPVLRTIGHKGHSRFMITIAQLDLMASPTGGSIYVVRASDFPESVPSQIPVPWWLHYGLGIPYYWLRALRYEGFSNQILPHVAFVTSIVLVVCKLWFADPAGVFGLLGRPPE